MNKTTMQIIEYQKLYSDDKKINKEIFKALENFILENDTPFLLLKSYRGKKYIQAQNYVGIIQLKNGFTLEILPKITNLEEDTENNIKETKGILIKMINSIENIKTITSWAEIFLLNESFSIYKGKNIAFALLFDMNVLFESYIGQFFKKNCKAYREYNIKLQSSKYHLAYNGDNKYFKLKPDVVIEITDDDNKVVEHVIFDTKWKYLTKDKKISQNDMYQLYAYGTKYENCNKLYLVYPLTKERIVQTEYKFNENIILKVLFFDLKIDEFII